MSFDLESFVRKYDVHPETVALFKAQAANIVKPYPEVGVEIARQLSLERSIQYGGRVELDGSETEIIIPSPYDKDGLPVTVYRPTSCDSMEAPPILVYFHGGGNTIGSRQTHETVCKILASGSAIELYFRITMNVNEHKFPANNDDAKLAVEWVAANRTAIGAKAGSKLGVSGDSAGGRLAAVVCHEATELIDFSVLIYPNVSSSFEHASVKEFNDGPVLPWSIIAWFMEQYITDEDKTSPRASVILNKDFSKFPPTLIIVAELDPLRDGCYAYFEKLKEAGVAVDLITMKGVPHSFWSLPVAYPETCKEAHTATTTFIKSFSG